MNTRGEHGDTSAFDRDLDLPEVDWTEGVEEYKSCTADELWDILGIPERSIPFFNPKHNSENQCDPWTEEGTAWLRIPSNGEPLVLHWHQLVGVVKMVENAFSGKPVLLMDGVGLGKTIQMAGFIAVLSWYRDYFATHGRFPGKFGPCSLSFPPIYTHTYFFSQRKGSGRVPPITSLTFLRSLSCLLISSSS